MNFNQGSIINSILSRSVIGEPTPEVGMGATFLSYSDRSAGTIIRVFKIGQSLAVEVQADDAKRIDNNGMSESQEYEFTRNPNAPITTFKKDKRGFWVHVYRSGYTDRWVKSVGGLRIGEREEYFDPHF